MKLKELAEKLLGKDKKKKATYGNNMTGRPGGKWMCKDEKEDKDEE